MESPDRDSFAMDLVDASMESPRRNSLVLDIVIVIALILYAVLTRAYNDVFSIFLLVLFIVLLRGGIAWFAHRNTARWETRLPALRRNVGQGKRKHALKTRQGRAVCHRFRGQNTARTAFFPLDTGLHVLRFTFPPDVTVSVYLESADRQHRATILSRTSPPDSGHVDIETAGEYALAVELFGVAAINEWQIEIEPV